MRKLVSIDTIKENSSNPRFIKDDKYKKLLKSLREFPQMLEKRPIVVDENNTVLGGNMRLKACKELGLKEIWIDTAEGWTEKQKSEFIIKDNVGYGEWDWDILANEWDSIELIDWGLDVPNVEDDVDYSILDGETDFGEQLEDMTGGVKKAIQIEFEADDYQEAFELVKFWRSKKAYVGGMIIRFLNAEKENL